MSTSPKWMRKRKHLLAITLLPHLTSSFFPVSNSSTNSSPTTPYLLYISTPNLHFLHSPWLRLSKNTTKTWTISRTWGAPNNIISFIYQQPISAKWCSIVIILLTLRVNLYRTRKLWRLILTSFSLRLLETSSKTFSTKRTLLRSVLGMLWIIYAWLRSILFHLFMSAPLLYSPSLTSKVIFTNC